MFRDKAITELRQKFEKNKKERDDLKLTLEKFEGSSKNLNRLLDSQQCNKSRTGLCYDSQGFDSQGFDSQVLENQVNDRYNTSEGYHAIPLPYKGKFMPLEPDLLFADAHVVCESITSLPVLTNSGLKTLNTARQTSSRAAISVNTARSISTDYPRSTMNGDSTKVKTFNEDVQIRVLIDKKKIIVTEASIRLDLQLQDAKGTSCLPNDTIFEELARIGTMASAIICLATNQKFNFSKYIFVNMVKNLKAKVFANVKREGNGFSAIITPLFETMMVQAPEEVGECSEVPTDTHHTPIVTQPSSSQPQKKQTSRKKQRKEIEVPHTEPQTEESVPTTSNDPLPSGDQEDASKQERMIDNIDQNVEITLVNETQGRINEEEMFGVNDLEGDEVIVDATACEEVEQSTKVAKKEVSTADLVTTTSEVVTTTEDVEVTAAAATPQISKDELTLAQNLREIKAAKPKARGVIVQEQSEFRTTSSSQPLPLLQAEDKGKGIMIEPEKPLKKEHQISFDEEVARKLEAQMKAKKKEEETIAREKDEKEDDSAELKRCLEIVPEDDDGVTIEATPLSSKSPTIVDYKIYKEGKKSYFKISRADENSQSYLTFRKMFKNFNREDLEVLWSIVKERFKKTKPVDDMDNILFQTLKTMFKHHAEDNI
uniref:Uncharacterized protein n=1 Tax=Tanacetum cinerariifolium TaxID=118510 RepID=A0A6L2KAI6_TANCI|nr:hypothetical protein [Tanacetum cinerariifolium]